MTRTFSRSDWEQAQVDWLDFGDEWKPYRHQAAMRGMLFPPEGTKWDSWDDDRPTQRAMLVRSIRETPSLLSSAIAHSRSWGQVIAYVLKRRDEMREELEQRQRDIARDRADEPDGREASKTIKQILTRIDES